MKCLCLKAMGIAYERHAITIGSFTDSKYIVSMLEKCNNFAERDHLIFLISKLVFDKNNVRELITAGVIPLLIDLALLAHLHITRAQLPSLAIKFDDNQVYQSPEWMYLDGKEEKVGPFSFHDVSNLHIFKLYLLNFFR